MWQNGAPAGLCNEPVFGKRPPTATYCDPEDGHDIRLDGRYSGYVPGEMGCPRHGGLTQEETPTDG